MDIGVLEQLVAGLSIVGSGIHQVHRFSKKIGAIEARLQALDGIYAEYKELNEQQEAMKIRQDYLEREIRDLQKYN